MKTSQPLELRAREAAAQALIQLLQVPTIFFDAAWPSTQKRVDMLVIDRAGFGDVHVVTVAKSFASAIRAMPKLMKVPAQFRWICYPSLRDPLTTHEYDQLGHAPLFSATGMGRVGAIIVRPEEDVHGDTLEGEIAVRAERFPGSYYDEIDTFRKKHKPDIEFR